MLGLTQRSVSKAVTYCIIQQHPLLLCSAARADNSINSAHTQKKTHEEMYRCGSL